MVASRGIRSAVDFCADGGGGRLRWCLFTGRPKETSSDPELRGLATLYDYVIRTSPESKLQLVIIEMRLVVKT